MNPREAALLAAAAQLLNGNRDTAYGPAHAVRDALALEQEVAQQLGAQTAPTPYETEALRALGAL